MRLSKEASWGRLLKVSGFGTDTSGTPPTGPSHSWSSPQEALSGALFISIT
jgi:hypothetical protein